MNSTIAKFKLIYPDIVLEELRNGGYMLKKYTGHSETMVIPGCVESIGSYCFLDNKSIKHIKILDEGRLHTLYIGRAAFKNTTITDIKINCDNYEIGDLAFAECISLSNIDLKGWNVQGLLQFM